MSVTRKYLEIFLNKYLKINQYTDYGPNGLQIEGKQSISKITFAVSATAHSVSESVKSNSDALIVHHGLFWKFHGPKTLTGPFAKRVFPLVENKLSLFAYHLPLDAHLEVGNAALIGKKLMMKNIQPFGDYKGMPTGISGDLADTISKEKLSKQLEKILNHKVIYSRADNDKIKSLGIITGGANSDWILAKERKLDAYLTGEMSEHDWHESAESNVAMFAGGHNATEAFGIQALMKIIQEKFDVECSFIESDNPA